MKIMTKRFLVAVCLLVVSATLLGSASFAWFSMNTNVNVDGIEVEAYSDALFLEIKGSGAEDTFGVSAKFSGDKKALRLVTNAFIANETIVKIKVTPVDGGNYTSGVYYVKADSDVTNGKDNYVLATDLVPATDTSDYVIVTFTKATGTYTVPEENEPNEDDPELVEEDEGENIATPVTVYYAKDLATNSFVPVNDDLENGDSLAPYYTATITEQEETVYNPDYTYYEYNEDTGVYHIVGNLELGTAFGEGKYFTIEYVNHDEDFEDDTDEPADEPTDDPELQNEDEEATEPVGVIADYYYVLNANNEYSCLGFEITEDLDTYPEFYWGRAYSNTLGAVQGTNTLNVLRETDLPAYVYTDTVYLRSAKNTNTAQDLKIAEVKIGGKTNALSAALRVLFVAKNGNGEVKYFTYDNGTRNITEIGKEYGENEGPTESAILFDTLLGDEGEIVTVQMYIYFDGTDDAAFTATEDAGLLNGQTVEVKFTIAEQPYNA